MVKQAEKTLSTIKKTEASPQYEVIVVSNFDQGSIAVETQPGRGSVFTVRLPLAELKMPDV